MGVRGLKTFIENNPGLFIQDYQLHNTLIVVDASNLISFLFCQSQDSERRDLFGGDLVQYGHHVGKFFDNLRKCNIEPILVFDGAQTYDESKSKTAEKHRRALNRFESVMTINRLGFGEFILPVAATNVFRSIAIDRSVKLVQCMFEADAEVARISHELHCPVVSNDSDFFLMDLPHGFITIDLLGYEHIFSIKSQPSIKCWLFKQTHLWGYLPGLDIKALPLVGVLAGNDFIESNVFKKVCERLPSYRGYHGFMRFRNVSGNQRHEKILRILNFITNHNLAEAVNLICQQVTKKNRPKMKALIRSNLKVYDIPEKDDFEDELRNLYWRGFSATDKNSTDALTSRFDDEIRKLTIWLKRAMEKSVLSYRCLELMNKNIVFIINHMDDPSLPSAHECQHRPTQVMLSLLRRTYKERSHCVLYDRFGGTYAKRNLYGLRFLDRFGTLNYTFYDLPDLSDHTRRSILFATFHGSEELFNDNLIPFYDCFDANHAVEFLLVKILFEYIDVESHARLWTYFRQATLLCMIYHFILIDHDSTLIEIGYIVELMGNFRRLVSRYRLDKIPVLNKRRKYNCRLMHQVNQLQSSIISFNGLNAFLGDVITRIRPERWLNSCLIYNTAEGLRNGLFKIPDMPEIIHIRPDG